MGVEEIIRDTMYTGNSTSFCKIQNTFIWVKEASVIKYLKYFIDFLF